MKKFIISSIILISHISFGQSTAMIAVVLEDGKESEYLATEKNWNIAAQAMVDAGIIAQWSVWKRTPREGDDNWAQYYIFRRTTAQQDANPKNFDKIWDVIYPKFKGKSKKHVRENISTKM